MLDGCWRRFVVLVLLGGCVPRPAEPPAAAPATHGDPAGLPDDGAAEIGLGSIGTGTHAPSPVVEAVLDSGEADLEVRGEVDAAAVEAEIDAHRDALQACADAHQRRHPDFVGALTLHLVIGTDGKVTNTSVELRDGEGAVVDGGALPGCVAKAARGWELPPPSAGVAIVVQRFGVAPRPPTPPSPP